MLGKFVSRIVDRQNMAPHSSLPLSVFICVYLWPTSVAFCGCIRVLWGWEVHDQFVEHFYAGGDRGVGEIVVVAVEGWIGVFF